MATKLVSPIRYNAAKPLEVRYDFASVGALLNGSYSYPEGALFNATEDSTSGGVSYPAGLYEYKKDENNELKWVKVNTDGLTEADKATLNQLKDNAICGKSNLYMNRFGHVAFGDDEEAVSLTLADFGITEGMTRDEAIEAGLIVNNELTQLPSGFNLLKFSDLKDWMNAFFVGKEERWTTTDDGYLINDIDRKRIYIGDCTKVVFLSSTTQLVPGVANRKLILVKSFVVDIEGGDDGLLSVSSPNWTFTETEGVGYMKMLSSREYYHRNEFYNVKYPTEREFVLLTKGVEEVDTIDEHTKNTDIPSVGALKAYVEENGGSGSGGTTNYNNLTNKPLVNESDGSVSATGELKLKKGTADEVNVAAKLASLELETSNFATKSELNNKQDKLIAGANITIGADGKTISASGGGSGSATLYSTRGQQTDGAPTNKLLDDNLKVVDGVCDALDISVSTELRTQEYELIDTTSKTDTNGWWTAITEDDGVESALLYICSATSPISGQFRISKRVRDTEGITRSLAPVQVYNFEIVEGENKCDVSDLNITLHADEVIEFKAVMAYKSNKGVQGFYNGTRHSSFSAISFSLGYEATYAGEYKSKSIDGINTDINRCFDAITERYYSSNAVSSYTGSASPGNWLRSVYIKDASVLTSIILDDYDSFVELGLSEVSVVVAELSEDKTKATITKMVNVEITGKVTDISTLNISVDTNNIVGFKVDKAYLKYLNKRPYNDNNDFWAGAFNDSAEIDTIVRKSTFAYVTFNLRIEMSHFVRVGKNSYYGRKWACMGDSLTENNNRTTKHYHDYIATRNNMTVYNLGKSGTGYGRTYNSNLPFYQRVSDIPEDSDVLTIFGSFNDVGAGLSIGEVTDNDTTTLCGCMNKTLENIYALYPLLPIGIISPTPWKIYNKYNNTATAEQYVTALKGIAERWNIPFLDLYHGSLLRPWEESYRALCYSKDDNNGIHPDEQGHKLIAPMIETFVKSIVF